MGAEPWSYFVPYREDIAEALDELKQQEFAAGRYDKPWGFEGTHATIAEALEAGEADGTRSILDMEGVADSPRTPDRQISDEDDPIEFATHEEYLLGQVAPITSKQLMSLYGTERPTRALVEANDDYYNLIGRGMGIYLLVYDNDEPSEILFAGYSYD